MTFFSDTQDRQEASVARGPRPSAVWLLAGLACLAAALLAGLLSGPVRLGSWQIVRRLLGLLPGIPRADGLSRQQEAILMQLRLPRVILAGLVGAALALSGAAFQGAFRNPLADPYLLGAASGAGLGATIVIGYVKVGLRSNLTPAAAFAGALLAVGFTYIVGRGAGGRGATSFVLAGVAVTTFFTAVQTYLQQRQSQTLREVYGWILGRLSTTGWNDVVLVLPYVVLGGGVILAHGRLLDLLSLGDEEAETLGVNAPGVRGVVIVAASLATAAAVAVSGLIGFVGLIIPHAVRLLAGSSYRAILPLSVLFGAAFLILADLLGRTLISPAELPIGVVTAFFGAPFFVAILRTRFRASA